MKENKEENPASQQLTECIAFLEQCLANFEYASSRLSLCDKARNDLLHSLELYDNDATARARTVAKLKMCLLERRIYKDMVESYAPIVTVLHGKKYASLIHTLSCVLGQVEKVERNHHSRRYNPRVLDMETLNFKDDEDCAILEKAL